MATAEDEIEEELKRAKLSYFRSELVRTINYIDIIEGVKVRMVLNDVEYDKFVEIEADNTKKMNFLMDALESRPDRFDDFLLLLNQHKAYRELVAKMRDDENEKVKEQLQKLLAKKAIEKRMARIRQPDEYIICIGGRLRGKKETTNMVEKYQAGNQQWGPFTHLQQKRSHFGVASYQNEIYVVGGHDGIDALDSVEVLQGTTWRMARPLPTPVESMAVCSIGGYVYSIGGCGNNQLEISNTYRLNIVRSEWEKMKSLEIPRVNHIAAVVEGLIIVSGGQQRKDKHFRYLKSTECYRIVNNQWVSRMPALHRRACAGSVVINDEIYVFGGKGSEGYIVDIEAYDHNKNMWTVFSKSSMPRAFSGVTYYQGRVFVVGGDDKENEAMAIVDSFSIKDRHWETEKALQIGRTAAGVVALRP